MYKLQKTEDDGTVLTLEFRDDKDIWDIRWMLRQFLLGSGYLESTVNLILPVEDRDIMECDE